jgi:hypothetical protein
MLNTCQSCGVRFEAEEAWKKLCFPCWKEKRDAENPKKTEYRQPATRTVYVPVEIPKDMLKILINLCHPDRHDGKDIATKATQYLLGLRK